MKYSQIRDRIDDGDVVAYSFRRGWFTSWYAFKVNFVRLAQMSEYSHIGFVQWQDGRLWLVDAVTPFVRNIPLSDDLPCFIVSGRGLTPEQRLKAMALVGKARYSIWDAIKAFFGVNDREDDRISCGELVNLIFSFPCKDTPAEIVRYLLATGSTLYEVNEV
jgi:hypothetical protein